MQEALRPPSGSPIIGGWGAARLLIQFLRQSHSKSPGMNSRGLPRTIQCLWAKRTSVIEECLYVECSDERSENCKAASCTCCRKIFTSANPNADAPALRRRAEAGREAQERRSAGGSEGWSNEGVSSDKAQRDCAEDESVAVRQRQALAGEQNTVVDAGFGVAAEIF